MRKKRVVQLRMHNKWRTPRACRSLAGHYRQCSCILQQGPSGPRHAGEPRGGNWPLPWPIPSRPVLASSGLKNGNFKDVCAGLSDKTKNMPGKGLRSPLTVSKLLCISRMACSVLPPSCTAFSTRVLWACTVSCTKYRVMATHLGETVVCTPLQLQCRAGRSWNTL